MRVVKALVAFMGVLIVVGIGLVAYGLSLDKNATDTETAPNVTKPSVPVSGSANAVEHDALAEFGDIVLDVKYDERLVGYTVQGDQVTLHIEGANGNGARLIIVSLGKKTVLGRIILKHANQ